MTLKQLPAGKRARITNVQGEKGLRSRMLAMGLRSGREVAVIRRAAMGGPLHVRIGSTDLMMRGKEADLIRLAVADSVV